MPVLYIFINGLVQDCSISITHWRYCSLALNHWYGPLATVHQSIHKHICLYSQGSPAPWKSNRALRLVKFYLRAQWIPQNWRIGNVSQWWYPPKFAWGPSKFKWWGPQTLDKNVYWEPWIVHVQIFRYGIYHRYVFRWSGSCEYQNISRHHVYFPIVKYHDCFLHLFLFLGADLPFNDW